MISTRRASTAALSSTCFRSLNIGVPAQHCALESERRPISRRQTCIGRIRRSERHDLDTAAKMPKAWFEHFDEGAQSKKMNRAASGTKLPSVSSLAAVAGGEETGTESHDSACWSIRRPRRYQKDCRPRAKATRGCRDGQEPALGNSRRGELIR